jgi:DNA-binding winged helix-turn-helix (wHTH) protein
MRVSFGDYAADFTTREVLRRGERVHLSPKAFRLLELLVTQRPRALSKAELQDALWPEVYVQESNLADLVSELRAALEQTGQRGGIIRTLHGFGYAFSGEAQIEGAATPPTGAPSWRVTWSDGQAVLGEGEHLLGRDPSATISIDEPTVSWTHASLVITGSGERSHAALKDLQSRNGTYRNGERLTEPAEVHDGEELRLGTAKLFIHLISRERSPTRPMEGEYAHSQNLARNWRGLRGVAAATVQGMKGFSQEECP